MALTFTFYLYFISLNNFDRLIVFSFDHLTLLPALDFVFDCILSNYSAFRIIFRLAFSSCSIILICYRQYNHFNLRTSFHGFQFNMMS